MEPLFVPKRALRPGTCCFLTTWILAFLFFMAIWLDLGTLAFGTSCGVSELDPQKVIHFLQRGQKQPSFGFPLSPPSPRPFEPQTRHRPEPGLQDWGGGAISTCSGEQPGRGRGQDGQWTVPCGGAQYPYLVVWILVNGPVPYQEGGADKMFLVFCFVFLVFSPIITYASLMCRCLIRDHSILSMTNHAVVSWLF